MQREWRATRIALLSACLLLTAGAARADKIVLKNGRIIVAYNVVEDGDKVRYETSAGQLALPKSIVDHIERGGLLPVTESPAEAAANLNIAPPALEPTASTAEIDQKAVRDGAIDRDYIARLEVDARVGSTTANERAALAHHAASQFELSQGDLEHALSDARAAASYMPGQPVLLMNVAYIQLQRNEFRESLVYLDRAKKIAPNNGDVYKLSGWAYYGMNKLEPAKKDWEKAQSLHPDAEVQAALEKVRRDIEEEANYRENESAHFELHYNGASEPALAREVMRTLEGHYQQIESELNYSPPDPIGVVLYTQQGFADITQAPGWVGALNDGRIRVPVQGLTGVTPDLSRVLRHELTHSFIQQKTHGRAPTWLQEGVAQWMEGKRSDESASVLVQVYEQGHAAPLGKLEGSWMGLTEDMVRYSYAWALANVEYIVQTEGMGGIEKILDRIAAGNTTEEGIHEVLRSDYGDLMQNTAEYLKKNYAR